MASNNFPDLVLLILEMIFGGLHGSICWFLIRKRQEKNRLYCSPFYSFYLCIAFMDFLYVINNEFCSKIARLAFAQKFYEDMTFLASLLYFLSAYSSAGEMVGHTIIAVNRYYALKNAQVSEQQWSRRTSSVLSFSIFFIPFVLSIYRLPQDVRYKFPVDGYPSIMYTDAVFSKVFSYVNLGIYIACFIPSFLATIGALWNYRRIRKHSAVKSASARHELILSIHSMLMFACFFARFAYQVTLLIANYIKNDFIIQTAQFVIANVGSLYAFIGSVFLIIISSQVRNDYLAFYGLSRIDTSSSPITWTSASLSHG